MNFLGPKELKMSWIKIQNGLVTNKKTARLAREMKWSKLQTVGFLVSFWVWAVENCEDGLLKDTSDTEIAFGVGVENMDGIKNALVSSGLVDENPLRIHDWVEHQKDFLWGKYKDKPEKRQELLQSYTGVTPEQHSGKTERKKERKIDIGEGPHPTIQDVKELAEAEGLKADHCKFYHYQEARGWKDIKDWKASFRYWCSSEFKDKAPVQSTPQERPVWEDKEGPKIKKKNDWHERHLKGGKCYFCGHTVATFGVCGCKAYSTAFSSFCAKEGL